MKIVLTGAGTGGHFYPLIAVAEAVRRSAEVKQIAQPELYFFSNTPYDEAELQRLDITYAHVPAGKLRRYVSVKNMTDMFKTLVGLPTAVHRLFKIWPDVVFSKGGYTSVPTVCAAYILRIPVVVHDSDAIPGRANVFAGRFADRIAISYPEAAEFFSRKEALALVGNPVRQDLRIQNPQEGYTLYQFAPTLPTLLILGGSQGAEAINIAVIQALPELLQRYQIIHQTGKGNYEAHVELVNDRIQDPALRARYQVVPFLEQSALRAAVGISHLIISRAGSGAIFEIALWEKPSIIVPIPEDVSRDQRRNAYAYARSGAAQVIEQDNLTPHLLLHELDRLFNDTALLDKMREGAKHFQKPQAAQLIADELIRIGESHTAALGT